MLLSHTQLSHEMPFDEHFDGFPTKKVGLIEVADFPSIYSPIAKFSTVFNIINVLISKLMAPIAQICILCTSGLTFAA